MQIFEIGVGQRTWEEHGDGSRPVKNSIFEKEEGNYLLYVDDLLLLFTLY